MDLNRIDTIVQFTQGSSTAWSNVNVPVPSGAVVIDTVNKIIKEGNGVTLFANLPVCLDYNFTNETSGAITPVGDDNGVIAIASNQLYAPSTTKLADLLNTLSTLAAKTTTQQTTINSLNTSNKVLSVTQGTIDGTIVVCDNGKYGPGTETLMQLISDIIASINSTGTVMHIGEIAWYSDSELTKLVNNQHDITEHNTYWCKVNGWHDTAELRTVDFGLSTTQSGIAITATGNVTTHAILVAIYGGFSNDQFYGVATDASGNIFCAGSTVSEGSGTSEALIVKFDTDLNIISRKIYGGIGADYFSSVAVDSANNVICAGYTTSEGTGMYDTLIVKFDNNLTIIGRKRYGGSSLDYFYGVTVDANNNIICVGVTSSESVDNGRALVVKFDTNLTIVYRKIYGNVGNYNVFNSVAVDSSNNVICAGSVVHSGSSDTNALVVKFDGSLNLLSSKVYSKIGNDEFLSVVIDSNNNIICAGFTTSEGAGQRDALVVKFDTALSISHSKVYGGSGSEQFAGVYVDSSDNIICVGQTNSEGVGKINALIVKFDSNLVISAKKYYGGYVDHMFFAVTVDKDDNIVCVGDPVIVGDNNCLVMVFPNDIPVGTFTGTTISNITLTDSDLTLNDATLNLITGDTSVLNSASTLANSALTLSNSTLNLTSDVITAARVTVPTKLVTTIYTSAGIDIFTATYVDNNGNIFAVGSTTGAINEQPKALIVKFDSNFVALARIIYSGNYNEIFQSVAVDLNGDVICVGQTTVTAGGPIDAFIIKFNSTLSNIVAHKIYGGTGTEVFYDVAVDPANNIICVGHTNSEGFNSKDGLIVKFDANLNVLLKKRYSGSNDDVFNSIAFDANGNAVCVGYTLSEGPNTSGLIVKFDSNLTIVLRKVYNSTLGTATEFSAVAVTAANLICCVGRIIVTSNNKALVVTFDSNINVTGDAIYGGTIGSTEFTSVAEDSNSNIVCIGKTNCEGGGDYDAIILKLSSTLSLLGHKTYGTVGTDIDLGCALTNDDDIIVCGYGLINGSTDAIITKLPGSLPDGTYTNKFFTDIVLTDSYLTLSEDSATVNNSVLSLVDSVLSLTNSHMSTINAFGGIVTDTTIMDATDRVFKVKIGSVVGNNASIVSTFNISTDDGKRISGKSIDIRIMKNQMITSIYGGTGDDYFKAIAIDGNGNVICVGQTFSENINHSAGFVVKFDGGLNILNSISFRGTTVNNAAGDTIFHGVAVDSLNNIICVGSSTYEDGVGQAIVVKFDTDLNVIRKKQYGGTGLEYFNAVAVDSLDNIICAGNTTSEGLGVNDALVIKFDPNFGIIARKRYGGLGDDYFKEVAVDTLDNIICVGYTSSETSAIDALIVKFDYELNILTRKIYGGMGDAYFYGVDTDSSNNVICVGKTKHDNGTDFDAVALKLDTNLVVMSKISYGGGTGGDDCFRSVTTDPADNIIISGYTGSEGNTPNDCLVLMFDKNFTIIKRKVYGGSGDDYFEAVAVNSFDNIFGVGCLSSAGNGAYDALVVKIPASIPEGTFIGQTLTNLVLTDSRLTLSNPSLTLSVSNSSINTSILTLNNTLLIADNLTLNQVTDILTI